MTNDGENGLSHVHLQLKEVITDDARVGTQEYADSWLIRESEDPEVAESLLFCP
jgi:hypothetical protein